MEGHSLDRLARSMADGLPRGSRVQGSIPRRALVRGQEAGS